MRTEAAMVTARPLNFAARNAKRLTGLTRTKAAVQDSFSPATLPIASRIAVRTPTWLRFLISWATASLIVGVGTWMSIELAASLTMSGVYLASTGDASPNRRKITATTG